MFIVDVVKEICQSHNLGDREQSDIHTVGFEKDRIIVSLTSVEILFS